MRNIFSLIFCHLILNYLIFLQEQLGIFMEMYATDVHVKYLVNYFRTIFIYCIFFLQEQFELVNRAYELLCSKQKQLEGPDPNNLVLIIRTQSILFSRFKDVLEPYKYAGYSALIKTIKLETGDSQLFSKSAPLLGVAAELSYHTVNCSALNARELRREGGIEVRSKAGRRDRGKS